MRSIQIEFAPDSVTKRLHYASLPVLLLAAFTLILLCGLALRGKQLMQASMHATEKVQALTADIEKVEKRQIRVPTAKLPQEQVIAINQAVAKLNLPWTDVFDALEKASSDRVALLQVTPNSQKASLKAIAETKNGDDMIAYIEVLKQQKLFTAVVLEKHEINERDQNKPYRFQFEVQWRDGVRQ
ncbi:PilN domain-containing protein [Undibacterium sp. Ji42W]|uniref:PilN domain-containing protein n=1 Tax=Undibacterium sp. Ji42W TaxID=3413039 RepID=UPI003BF3E4D0